MAERPWLLGEGDEEIVAQPLVDARAFHDVGVARDVVVSARDHAGDRAVGKVGEETGDGGACQCPGRLGDDALDLVELEHLGAQGAFWDDDDLVDELARDLEGDVSGPRHRRPVGEAVDAGQGDRMPCVEGRAHRRRALRFDADDLHLGVERVQPDRGSRQESAAAHGDDHGRRRL